MTNKTIKAVLFLFANVMAMPVLAQSLIIESPIKWRVQNYIPGNIITYFSSSSCGSGVLNFGNTASSDDKNRYIAMVATAKSTGRKIGVFYDQANLNCTIISFFME